MKQKTFLPLAALILAFTLVLTACGGPSSGSSTPAPGPTTSASGNGSAAPEPITITYWGKFGAGVNGDATRYLVDQFNQKNGKGITVQYEHIGSTGEIMAQVMTAVAGGTAPELIMMDNSTVPVLAENGVLADLSSYVARDSFDTGNILDNMSLYSYYGDQFISVPFARSNVVYVYNPDIFAECQVEPPKTIDELKTVGETIYAKKGIPAFCLLFDASFFQEALLVGMGSEGNISKDGKSPAALEDGSMKRLLSDWQSWIKAGWCMAPDVTSAEDNMKEAFYQGKLASMVVSTGTLRGLYQAVAETDAKMEVAYLPGYNGYQSGSGGSQIAAVAPGKSDAQIAAAWEFMKFMMEDENVAYFSVNSGYLPTTKTVLNTPEMAEFWAKYPGYKISVDQMEYASEPYWSIYRNDWNAEVKVAMSAVTQDGADVDEQIAYLEGQKANVFQG